MADRYDDRDRRRRDRDYERERDFYDRNYYGRNYYDRGYYDRGYYGRSFYDRNDFDRDYERDYYDRSFYGRYGRRYPERDYSGDPRYSPYGRDYDYDTDYGYQDYGYGDWRTDYGDWETGPYTGVGPQNYRRSDERIQDDVNDRLTWHGHINAREIEVSVDDGVVTLRGKVDSRRERRMAEEVAENVMGVWDVNNEINVRKMERRETEAGWQSQEGQTREGRMGQGQIREGMEVVGRDSERVGQVKKVRSNDFLIDRAMARDVYVPMNAANVERGRIHLNVQAGEVDNQGWEMPEIIETS